MFNTKKKIRMREERKREIQNLIYKIKSDVYNFINAKTLHSQDLDIIRLLKDCSSGLTAHLNDWKITFMERQMRKSDDQI